MNSNAVDREPLQVKFHAELSDYFGIFWVNTLLVVVTLGLYYPWAKVRTTRYLYSCTELQGSRFEYHATAQQLFKGFLIVYAGLFAYFVLSAYLPLVASLIVLIVLVLLPCLLVRSFKFKSLMTSYRGIRFQFNGTTPQAYKAALVAGLMMLLTAGLAAPWVLWRFKLFIFNKLQFGNRQFASKGTFRHLFKVYALSSLIYAALFILMFVFLFNTSLPENPNPEAMEAAAAVAMLPVLGTIVLAYLLLFLVVKPWVQATTVNSLWNNAAIGNNRVYSSIPVGKAIWVLGKNGVLTLLTLGLYYPAAVLNWWRLRFDYLSIEMTGDFDQIIATEQQQQG
ncbi:MAG: YjgN family protein, partial [Limnobacter sp.]|nr:YjgN family protein [Limnobacter sp.]